MTGTGMNTHNAEIINGTYVQNIGTTTLHTFCNDNNGFAIYAAGYTGNEIGETNSNKLVGTSATNNLAIDSGLATSAGNPDISNWAMKLAITQDSGDTTGTDAFTIDSAPNTTGGADASFTQYHVVPNEYTKVAHKNSATDMTTTTGGVKLTTTYAAYVSKTQPADTYTGQVIYTLVHPSDHSAPVANPAILDNGKTVNAKLKSIAATVVNGEETTITPDFDNRYGDWGATDSYIKSIDVHLETPAPAGFTPSEKNTISTLDSRKPIYAIFDNTDDAGIMHFYTEGEQIFLSPDSSFMFSMFFELADLSDISDWDTSNVTDMSNMFQYVGENISAFTLNVSSWDTSRVTDMSFVFYGTANVASTWSIVGLSNWDTSSVTNMEQMFTVAGRQADSFVLDLSSWDVSNVTTMRNMFENAGDVGSQGAFYLDLSSWDTSNVTDMYCMFETAGMNHRNWTIKGLSDWDTSSVTNMEQMFWRAGRAATTFSLDLSSWNTSSVTNMFDMFDEAGYKATTFSLNLSSWDVSSVTNITNMFKSSAGNNDSNATTFVLDLSYWNTTGITSMEHMFDGAGRRAINWSIIGLSSWDTSSVTNMSYMFQNAGVIATNWSVGDLSSWDTSKVTNMSYMFASAGGHAATFLGISSWNTSSVRSMSNMFNKAGYSTTTFSLDLSSWNTSSVTSMNDMFSSAGYNATTFTLDLSSWNTSSVTNMENMFKSAGYNATIFTLDLSSWNTSNVTKMSSMFNSSYYYATTWSVTIPPTNGNGINNTTSRLYGKTSSTYIASPSGKSFTLAQP